MILEKLFYTICILFAMCSYMSGQARTVSEYRNGSNEGLNGEMTRVTGLFDHSLNIQMLFSTQKNGKCTGFIRMGGSEEMINLEGECSDTSILLYEFDKFARVSGIITGKINQKSYQLKWSNFNNTKTFPLEGREDLILTDKLKVYRVKDEKFFDQLLIWPDRRNINVSQNEGTVLKWQEYSCPLAPYACQYLDWNYKKQSLSISDRMVSLGNRLFQFVEELEIRHLDKHSFNNFYNYSFPVIGDKNFDQILEEVVLTKIQKFENDLDGHSESDPNPKYRLNDKAFGDFYISLASKDLISGYLSFTSTKSPRLETFSFSYDRLKKKYLTIKDIWRGDFDFLYYLKSLIENKKREIISEEEPLIKLLLKEEPFSHFNLTPNGIVFFTDYNFVFGRRTILIPYTEIQGFIDNKSLENLIKSKS